MKSESQNTTQTSEGIAIYVDLLETIDDEDSTAISMWKEMRRPLDALECTQAMQRLVDAHAETIRRVAMSDYHYRNLNQIYFPGRPSSGAHATSWVESEAVSIVFLLYSALDSESARSFVRRQQFALKDREWCRDLNLGSVSGTMTAFAKHHG